MHTSPRRMTTWMPLAIALLATAAATADDWANWRGPNHNGTSDETDLPTEWSDTDNILWSATLPGPSSSTPIVSGDRVFVSSSGESEKQLHALCFDRRTGERLWGRLIAESKWVPHRSGMSLSSPVTDGKLVYFIYGTSDLFALDFDGNEVWSKNMDREVGPITPLHGYGASPLLHNGKLYIPMIRGQWRASVRVEQKLYTDKDSFITCLDAETGDLLWKVHRPSHAFSESFDSYATPVLYNHGGIEQLIFQGGDVLTGHSAETGEELWRQVYNRKKQKYWQIVPTPVIADDIIVAMLPKSRAAFALRPEVNTQYEYEDSLWIYTERTTHVPSPIYYKERLYIINGARRTIMCLDPKTGEEIWSEYLGTKARIWATPTAADGKIYCFSETGETIVVAADDTFKIVAHNPALPGNGEAHSSIAIANGNLFIRTGSALYCVGD